MAAQRRRLIIRGADRASTLDAPITSSTERHADPIVAPLSGGSGARLPRCLARTWAGGAGDQCSRSVMCSSGDYCAQHQKAADGNGLPHGRVDEPMAFKKATAHQARGQQPEEENDAMEDEPVEEEDAKVTSIQMDHRWLYPLQQGDKGTAIESIDEVMFRSQFNHVTGGLHGHHFQRQAASEFEQIESCPKPVAEFDRSRCAARVWARGRGLQCTRKVFAPHEFCAFHQRDHDSQHGLAHGRIDELVPASKIKDFMNARSSLTSFSSESGSSSSDSDTECAPVQKLARPIQRSRLESLSQQAAIPEVCCILIFRYLVQNAIFRAAMVCRLWSDVIQTSHLFSTLDFRSVGIWLTCRGRRASLTADASEKALWSFAAQPRFSKATKLDLRGLMIGRQSPERSCFLQYVASRCPSVRHILLQNVGPLEQWSDLSRFMSAGFARSLLRWWPGIVDQEMVIECHRRHYYVSGMGGSPQVRVCEINDAM